MATKLYYGVYAGTVVTNADPNKKNRVRLHVPQVLGKALSGWAEPLAPVTSKPAVGDVVWAFFVGGDARYPVYSDTKKVSTSTSTLASLSDVQIPSPANRQVLRYSSSSSKWQAATLTTTDIGLGWHNVTDSVYGAKGDGINDDRAAIQAAVDAAASAGGGVVYFPDGKYLIKNSIVVKTGVAIQGTHGSGWPFRFPNSRCVIICSADFAGECAISMLGADITGNTTGNEGAMRIFDIDLSGENLPSSSSISGIHAQGEVMDVVLQRMGIKQFTHNGIHANIGTGTRPPHDWFMDRVVCYANKTYGFSMNITDGFIDNCIASSNGLDGWFLGPLGSLTMKGCQALWNTQHGFNIAGGSQVGNLSLTAPLTDRNGHDGIHLGPSTGAGSPYVVISGATLNRDGSNGGLGGAGYAGLRIDGFANPIIINGIICETGVGDDGTGANAPQYGLRLTGANAYVQINGGYFHGDSAGVSNDGATVVFRRFNVDEASGSKTAPTLNYGKGVVTEGSSLSVSGQALGLPKPNSQNLIAWTIDPAYISAGKAGIAGTLYLASLEVAATAAPTKLYWGISTAGVSPVSGQNWVGIYNSAGVLAASVNVDAQVATGNSVFTTTIAPGTLAPGKYWIAFLFNAATMPAIWRGGDSNAVLFNIGVAGIPAQMRFATNGTALTALPSNINPNNNASAQFAYFGALGI